MTVDSPLRQLRLRAPLLIWLVLIWNLLWGTWSWANLITGVLVALTVTVVLPLPVVAGGARIHPLPALYLIGHFLVNLTVSSAQVAWQTLRPSGIRQSAVIRVQLRTDSDLLLSIISQNLTLVPGSMVLDLDRRRMALGVHVLDVGDEADVERQRAEVLATERRVVRAFGSAEDIARLDQEPPQERATAPATAEPTL
ncbi:MULTISPECIES: Na+/H+ antiporter subunit E [unclassified Modestobacter]|uniref:Na+/H+ antiporter subunit E n=1 Tax=unclassified Modestobacter TaxID=2643866 RepID=UPI0022AA6BB4|nr:MULTISPECIES: Na+/H+ antiporter subunit E [unclassified Modestobacter]MCZ2825472.1 Na+/H+ antiporter subunit E [Modestobacter sp. VKM Ac-2981]MCZ2853463.1 Na+/H+ antiporter subunit E [Modestobacter sp. VKM Ac-2982]